MLSATYKLIQEDSVLVAQPLLIQHYGRVGASLIQQIYYWSQKGQGVVHNQQRWIYNTIEQWAEQLCVSASTIKRAVQKLLKDGAIRVQKLSKHKSNQTNSYTLNHERLKEILDKNSSHREEADNGKKEDNEERSSFKTSRKAHQFKMTPSLGQSDPMVTQKITYKNKHNKSEDFVSPEPNKTERDDVPQTQPCMASSENIISQIGEEVKKDHRTLPSRLAQSMMDIWNNEVFTKKNANKMNLSRDISKYLVASYKYRFDEDLYAWKHYCSLIASSSYLMSEAFSLSLSWALKFGTIDRILAGEFGVGLRGLRPSLEKAKSEEEGRAEALRHIDGVGESDECKATRRMILSAVGSAHYNAWFTKVDLSDDGATLKPYNTFVEAAIQTRFGHVLERVGQ